MLSALKGRLFMSMLRFESISWANPTSITDHNIFSRKTHQEYLEQQSARALCPGSTKHAASNPRLQQCLGIYQRPMQ